MSYKKFIKRLVRAIFISSLIIPLAGLFMRLTLGSDEIMARMIYKAGESLLDNFDLILAITLAAGLASKDRVTAPISAAVAFLTCNAVYSLMDPAIDTGILLGLFFGLLSAVVHSSASRYLPWQGQRDFITTERFAPLLMALIGLVVGGIVGLVWPSIQTQLSHLAVYMIEDQSMGPFLFGIINRLLIVTGLHHVVNSHAWLETGTYVTQIGGVTKELHGDMVRFIAGDPTAGIYETGFYLVMIFGLPAMVFALYHKASYISHNTAGFPLLRKNLIAIAAASIILGVTEPIEYVLFVAAFPLFLAHALLTGVALAVCQYLDIHHGFAFSGGLIDYFSFLDLSKRSFLLPTLGLAFALVYYYLTSWYITKYRMHGINFLYEDSTLTHRKKSTKKANLTAE